MVKMNVLVFRWEKQGGAGFIKKTNHNWTTCLYGPYSLLNTHQWVHTFSLFHQMTEKDPVSKLVCRVGNVKTDKINKCGKTPHTSVSVSQLLLWMLYGLWPFKKMTFWTELSPSKQLQLTQVKALLKGKPIPLQAWRGPEGSRKLRLLDFKTIGNWRW
jgi:hypothetical protein